MWKELAIPIQNRVAEIISKEINKQTSTSSSDPKKVAYEFLHYTVTRFWGKALDF